MKILKFVGGVALGYLVVKGVQTVIRVKKMHEEDPELQEAQELYKEASENYREILTEKLHQDKERRRAACMAKLEELKNKAEEAMEGGAL